MSDALLVYGYKEMMTKKDFSVSIEFHTRYDERDEGENTILFVVHKTTLNPKK